VNDHPRITESLQFQFGTHFTQVHLWTGDCARILEERMRAVHDHVLVADRATAGFAGIEAGDVPAGSRTERRDAAVILPSGEGAKEWESVSEILHLAVERRLGRDGTILGLGGGVVCDVSAFAASTYMRGCRLQLIPTTLLAMADAALGGKTGVNFAGYKNMVGTFYPAQHIHIVPSTLQTLPEREYHSGLAEVIKSAMLGDGKLLELLETHQDEVRTRDPEVVREMVQRSLSVKGSIVERDFTEEGVRAYLNLGHTFAHALEALSNFSDYTHGEAVAWGLAQALRLGRAEGLTDSVYADRVDKLLDDYGFVTELPDLDWDALFAAMQQDKKKQRGTVRFVLQEGLAATELRAVPLERVRETLAGPLSRSYSAPSSGAPSSGAHSS
jgi:3-dehydroquinate synthase